MPAPLVTVIIPVFDVRPWLAECVASVRRQTIGTDNIEVIAVDDRSRDGSWEELERLAADFPELRVHRLPENSGGPGGPRNFGLDRAKGTYVFFLDADDYLGDEALERMVAMAERASSDVLLGRMATPPGHRDRAPKSMFGRSADKVDLYKSNVFNSLGPWKLFRREMIERHGIRFPEGVARREDGPFTSRCYLNAEVISILADYDCYYLRTRPDGSNATSQRPDYPALHAVAADLVAIVADHVPPGPKRDHLMARHVRTAVLTLFSAYWARELTPAEKRETFELARAVLKDCLTDGVLAKLDPRRRLMSHLIAEGEFEAFQEALPDLLKTESPAAVVDGERVYRPLNFFRDETLRVPDSVYDLTDRLAVEHRLTSLAWSERGLTIGFEAVLPDLSDRPQTVSVIVRARDGKTGHHVEATPAGGGTSFEAFVDVSKAAGGKALADGLWDLSVSISAEGVRRERRLGARRAESVETAADSHEVRRPGGSVVATTFFSKHGNLGLDLGERVHSSYPSPRLVSLRSTTTSLRVVADYPPPKDARRTEAAIVLARGSARLTMPTAVTVESGAFRLTASLSLPILRVRPGAWEVRAEVRIGDLRREVAVVNQKGRPVQLRVLPRLTKLLAKLRR
ncbi:glycosyltransferase family 2 protein [Phytomonospora sp. NPDC050363]|uniref:glycosyltransferase family 2 protein n=1 Tax=Phytomonospora sp. NPDC050363 TaxID=3155642 RepID=UPI0033C182EE